MNRTVVVALALLATGCAYVDVPPGHVAVNWTLNGMDPKIYKEGEWNIGYYDKATVLDARSQEREERLYVLTSNGERIVLDASISYHIIADQALQLMEDEGIHYYSKLIGPVLRSQARKVIGRYLPEEIYSTKREAIEREIREGIEDRIKNHHLVLEAVLIRDITLPAEIQQAINDKLQAEQQSLKQKYLLDTARQVAERQKLEAQAEAERARIKAQADAEDAQIAAQGEAEQIRIRAKAQADAKEVTAKATSEAERLIQQHLTAQVLEWDRIKATSDLSDSPNSKVVVLGGGGKAAPLMQLP
jgi:regulator of protease activity HflC (stomatin/prohibitin superfamily)